MQSDIWAFCIAGGWKATALGAELWVEMVTGGWAEDYGRVKERRGRRGLTSPREDRGNKTEKVFIAHGSVEIAKRHHLLA